ncbi:MAG: 50S ribosomal protein L10 [bacterium]|nr:50S ribosomal protein L10 [bacterium]MCK6559384.1 50S ribosomal protein L10 [bacterium]NUM64710.1 50S ribosomal protein L10 [candidate division KSB1 bacterium]
MPETKPIRPEKQEVVTDLAARLSAARSVFVTDYSGLTVEAITRLRRQLRKSNVDFRVSKNTLTRLAATQVGMKDIVPHLEGTTAIAFGMGDPAAPAKVLLDFLKNSEKPTIRAFVFEGQFYDGKLAEQISKLPSRNELLARLLGGLNAPVTGLASSLQGIVRKLAYALNAVAEQKQQTAGTP